MSPRPADANLGQLVDDRYEIVRRVARGGMATVYEGIDRRLDRRIALKLMHPHLAESSDFVARFRREARAAARLSHPHVVAIHDQGTWHETGYLVMEHISGPNLRQVLRRRGALSVAESLDILEDMLDALGAAHRAGLVHRDIKPENVMLDDAGQGRPIVKVTDFGLARAVTEATAATTGTVLGTVAYLAPEIVTHGQADPRADIYAAGIVLFELLTGHTPLQGESPIQIAYQHVHESIPVPSSAVAWMPQEIDELVAAMTARDLTERPQDAAAARALVRRTRKELDEETLTRRADVVPAAAQQDTIVGGFSDAQSQPSADGDSAEPFAPQDGGEHLTAHEAGLRTAVLHLHEDEARESGGSPALGAPPADDSAQLVHVPIGAFVEPEARGSKAVQAPARRRRGWLVLILVLAVAAIGAALWFLVGPGAYRAIPDVSGQSQDEAVSTLAASDISANVVRENHDEVPQDLVIGTDPEAGDRVRAGSDVDLRVSDGVLMVQIPDVRNQPEDEALAVLSEAGLSDVSGTPEYDDTVPEGQVVAISPTPGSTVDHRTPVSVAVSQGPAPVRVPDISGVPLDEAQSLLADAGLTLVESGSANHDTVAEGSIIDQTPAAGSTLLRGDSVSVQVSEGPVMVEVPSVVGTQVDEGRQILQQQGFTVEVNEVLGGFFGTVRSQEPAAGTLAPRGSVIRLTVV